MDLCISRYRLWLAAIVVLILAAGGAVVGGHVVFADNARKTPFVSSSEPDQIVLTWTGDPRTSQAIQWRTAVGSKADVVRFRRAADKKWQEAKGDSAKIEDEHLSNDKVCEHHTAQLSGLEPGADYVYEIGHGSKWTPETHFSTAPATGTKFNFIYMGDSQVNYEQWGTLLNAAFERHPNTAFLTIAGDLENNGSSRNEWDGFFHAGANTFNHVNLVPVLGNHDNRDKGAMYRAEFELPKNGPSDVAPELAYSFEYENALFVAMDSNEEPATQTAWLEKQLSETKATWRFVTFHHPIYSPRPGRDNKEIREAWCPVFDKYHVDMVLNGHDHSYMRMYPLKGGKRVDKPSDGTVYVTSVSCSKHYEQQAAEDAAVAFANVSTYQLIEIDGNHLTYRAYDANEKVMDELVIDK